MVDVKTFFYLKNVWVVDSGRPTPLCVHRRQKNLQDFCTQCFQDQIRPNQRSEMGLLTGSLDGPIEPVGSVLNDINIKQNRYIFQSINRTSNISDSKTTILSSKSLNLNQT